MATSAETLFLSQSRRAACTSWACSGVATLPVPIAQTGSYAMTTLSQLGIASAQDGGCWSLNTVVLFSQYNLIDCYRSWEKKHQLEITCIGFKLLKTDIKSFSCFSLLQLFPDTSYYTKSLAQGIGSFLPYKLKLIIFQSNFKYS